MKPKIIQSALDTIKSEVEKVKTEHAQTVAEIGKVKAEIKRLEEMPVCREDFAVLLQEHINAQAKRTDESLLKNLLEVHKGFHEKIEYDAFNKRGMKSLEVPAKVDANSWIFSWANVAGVSGGILAQGRMETADLQSLLCWLFPEVIHEKIMTLINAEIGAKWGNDELSRIAQRRETIADLTAELESLQARKAELEAALAEFGSLAEQNA